MDGQVFVSIQGFVFFLFFISNIHILSRIIVTGINTINCNWRQACLNPST